MFRSFVECLDSLLTMGDNTLRNYRPEIDGLRTLAVMPVVLFHAGVPGVTGGFVGVDIFFVISGYLISGILLNAISEQRFSLLDFYDRRIRRIFPALIFTYCFVFIVGIFIFMPNDLKVVGHSLAASALFFSNILFFFDSGYFDAPAHLKPLLHTWSLSVEEQFYVIWPLLLFCLMLLGKGWTIFITLCLALVSFTFAQIALSDSAPAAFFLSQYRAWELLLGALLALTSGRVTMGRWASEIGGLAGLALIFGSLVMLNEHSAFPGMNAAYPCLGAALIILTTEQHQNLTKRFLSLRPLVFVGLISYSLYLIHWPIVVYWRYWSGAAPQLSATLVIVVLSILIATLMWKYVEQPFRHGSFRFPAPKRVLIGTLSAALLAVFGYFFEQEDGFTFNLDPQVRSLNHQARAKNPYRTYCHGVTKVHINNDDICNFGAPLKPGGFDLLLLGDSNGDHFVPALSVLTKKAAISGRQMTRSRCPSLFGVRREPVNARKVFDCKTTQNAMRSFTQQNPNLKMVVLAHNWATYFEGRNHHRADQVYVVLSDQEKERSVEATRRAMRKALFDTVSYFLDRGIKVWILKQLPQFNQNPYSCVGRAMMRSDDISACDIDAANSHDYQRAANTAIDDVQATHPKISVFDPFLAICKNSICSSYQDNTLLYSDDNHLNLYGSRWIAQNMKLPDLD